MTPVFMPRLLILRMLEYGWLLGRNWWGHELLLKCISFQKVSQINSSAFFHASWLRISSLWNSVHFYFFFPSAPQNGWFQLNSSFFCLNSEAKPSSEFFILVIIFFNCTILFGSILYIFFSLLILSLWWDNVLILSFSSFYMVSFSSLIF